MVFFRTRGAAELLLAGYIAAFAALLIVQPGSDATFQKISDVAGVLPPMAGGVIALRASRLSAERARRGWLLIGLGCIAWGSGEVIWSIYEIVLGRPSPFPSWADVAYLGAVPLFFSGILVLTVPACRRRDAPGSGVASTRWR
jgi:hypothetical protein